MPDQITLFFDPDIQGNWMIGTTMADVAAGLARAGIERTSYSVGVCTSLETVTLTFASVEDATVALMEHSDVLISHKRAEWLEAERDEALRQRLADCRPQASAITVADVMSLLHRRVA